MEKSPMEVFQAFGQGLMSGTGSWKEVVAENITFIGPVDQTEGLEAFAKLNEQFMPMMKGNTIKQLIESDEFVITQILMDIEMPSGKEMKLDMTEWYEINNGKIQSIKVYYDAEEFRTAIKEI